MILVSASEKKFSEREDELKEIARSLLVEGGLSGFTIEQIASRSGYSRPTIYQHFSSKDDVLEAIANDCIGLYHEMVTRSLTCERPPWYRATAVVLAYAQVAHFHPTHFHVADSLRNPWIARRLPPKARARYEKFVELCIESFDDIFKLAQADGDLVLQEGVDTRQLTFHTIATITGVYSSIVKNQIIFRHANSESQWLDAVQCLTSLWEGYGWKKHEKDLPKIYDVVMRECFPDYWVKAQTEMLEAQVKMPVKAKATI